MSTIVAKQLRQEGVSIILKTQPAVGILALTAFVDDATPDTASQEFVKTFRYSKNGLQYTDWMPLTVLNITAISLTANDVFVAELNYYKDEPSGSSYLNVHSATITATAAASVYKPYFDNSLFKRYFNSTDPDVLTWYINVLEKMADKGMLASFIDKKADDGSIDDFLALWGATTKFCAFYVKLARVYSKFYENPNLIKDFLKQRGMITSPQDTLAELQDLLEKYFFHMAQRGTERIYAENATGTPDGELLRLINWQQATDEFLFNLYRSHHFGWNLGNSSPLHKGLRVNDSLNKIPWSKRGVSMTNAGPYISGAGSVVAVGGEDVAKFTNDGSLIFGLADKVKADPRMDYQISFQIKLQGNFTLQFDGWDKDGNTVQCTSWKTGLTSTGFCNAAVLSRNDKYITVKCYLYNKDRGVFGGDVLNIRQGTNLIAHPSLNKMGLKLIIDGTAEVKDFRIQPMQTDYSRGFVQVNNFISTWLYNRNGEYSVAGLTDYITRYLIPYNCHIKVTNIGDYLYTVAQQNQDILYWVGAGEYCRKVLWVGTDPSCEIVSYLWVPDDSTAYCEQIP